MEGAKKINLEQALSPPECLEDAPQLCGEVSSTPEEGYGELLPLCRLEKGFNIFVSKLPLVGALVIFLITALIMWDVVGRLLFNEPLHGITDLESFSMVLIGFSGMAYVLICRQSIQIDLFYSMFRSTAKRRVHLFGMLAGMSIAFITGWRAVLAAHTWLTPSPLLDMPEWPFVMVTGVVLLLCGVAFLFQILHAIQTLLRTKDYLGIVLALAAIVALWALPFVYRASDLSLSNLALGGIGFALLMSIMLLRVPLGWAMCLMGLLGLLVVVRRPEAALRTLGTIPFANTSSFLYIAFPMFMLMGELAFHSGMSQSLFDAANKWLGRLPGGLACASVGGCAGFGAVCGDSMATVITMSAVALDPMRKSGYSLRLATGSLAAGGTLGILIPPSMGFIIYSMLTEESIGKLFVAGILPGILLTLIFIGIIMVMVLRDPSLAPASARYSLKEKLASLVALIPIALMFVIVVGGILYGKFTPGEGGAVGAVIAALYGAARRQLTLPVFVDCLVRTASMFGKLFILFVGVYVFGAFLSASRLPNLLADTIVTMEVNRYLVLGAIIMLYIVLGCVMNIIPMMMLTLPSLFPTVQALGFDGVWFGVVAVIVMEMGMITPPVGMNVFTLASLQPDIPMSTIFRGVLPFFVGMMLCVLLIILFPQIALYLPSTL